MGCRSMGAWRRGQATSGGRGGGAAVTHTGVTPLGRPRALTATGGGCEGSMELRKAAGEWL